MPPDISSQEERRLTCPMDPRVDEIEKKLLLLEEKFSSAASLLEKTSDKLDEVKELVLRYSVEMGHIVDDINCIRTKDIPELKKCVYRVENDIVALKVEAAKKAAVWGSISAFLMAVLTSGAIALFRYVL